MDLGSSPTRRPSLSEVGPISAVLYQVNGTEMNVVFTSQRGLCFTLLQTRQDVQRLARSQSRGMIRLSLASGRIRTTSLVPHVSVVIAGGANEKVVGSHTGRIVAVVADEHPLWDGAKVKSPHKAVGVYHLARRYCEFSVTGRRSSSSPFPATVALHDLLPESLNWRACHPRITTRRRTEHRSTRRPHVEILPALRTRNIRLHRDLLSRGARPRPSPAVRGHLHLNSTRYWL
jgi:hypothetical protein